MGLEPSGSHRGMHPPPSFYIIYISIYPSQRRRHVPCFESQGALLSQQDPAPTLPRDHKGWGGKGSILQLSASGSFNANTKHPYCPKHLHIVLQTLAPSVF